MNGTSEVHNPLKYPPGLENLTGAELARLAANPKLREVVRAEFSRRPELLDIVCRGHCEKRLRLSASEPPRPNCRYTCKECCRDQSVLDSPDKVEKSLDGKSPGEQRKILSAISSARRAHGSYLDYADGTSEYCEEGYDQHRSEKGKETSRRWRNNHKEEAAEYKRAKRAGVSYVESRKQLMSNAAWEAKLKEFGYVCSTPHCEQPLTVKTAIRWAEGPTYVPVCRSCQGKKAAQERWRKEKSWKSR
jgi:hypothetical protein